jgi:hypothetical protein
MTKEEAEGFLKHGEDRLINQMVDAFEVLLTEAQCTTDEQRKEILQPWVYRGCAGIAAMEVADQFGISLDE